MKSQNIQKVTVIGTGIMGHGIAQVCAQAGYETSITRRRVELLQQALDEIKASFQTLVEKGIMTEEEAKAALSRVKCSDNLAEAVKNSDFVIEVVGENMDAKKQIFNELDGLCSPDTVLATNTSSFSITSIASATKRPSRVVGTHWWNPPSLMPLVEIVKGAQTSPQVVETTKEFITKLGKVPVICKDSPGFIGVRLQAALVTEAITMLQEELATAQDIDKAVKLTLGLRTPILGPLETVDLGGIDTFLHAYDYLYHTLGDRFKPPALLRNKVQTGELGIKTGKGIYDYTGKSIEAIIKHRDEWLIDQLKSRGLLKPKSEEK